MSRDIGEEIVVVINEFITHIKLSEQRRIKYYTKSSKKIPKKYQLNPKFDNKGRLLDHNNEPVISNPRAAGTPKLWSINGNELYASLNHNNRAVVMKKLKGYFIDKLKSVPVITQFPIALEIVLYRYKGQYLNETGNWSETFDLDNATWILNKSIQDTLSETGKIPDDNVNYINDLHYKVVGIDKGESRKLVIKIKTNNILMDELALLRKEALENVE